MVLCISGIPIDNIPQDSRALFQLYPHLKEGARQFCTIPVKCVGPVGLLYVSQRELAVTVPHDKNISILGTDDCTTCHIAVFRHTSNVPARSGPGRTYRLTVVQGRAHK